MTEVFIKILNMSISSCWIIFAVLILRVLLKRAPKWVQVLLWGLVAVRLLCPFSLESMLSLVPSANIISEQVMLDVSPTVETGIPPVDDVVNQAIAGSNVPETGASINPLQITFALGTVIWLIGFAVMLFYALGSYWILRRSVRTAVRVRENFYQSDRIDTPFVLGIFRPRIYMPFQIPEESMAHIIAHEKAHIRRKDHWWKPLGFLLLAVHWFNPLVWVSYILLCRDIELACDEKVIKNLSREERADYSAVLLSSSSGRKIIAACPVAFGEVSVKTRIKSVLNYRRPAFWAVLIALILCCMVAVCFLTNPVGASGEPDLSFLNYENAMSLVCDRDEVRTIYCPLSQNGSDNTINVGSVNGQALANYLDLRSWKIVRKPNSRLPSPGSIEFVIDDDYRIQVYKRTGLSLHGYAVVTYGEEKRYYSIRHSDYQEAVDLLNTPKAGQKEDLWEITQEGDSYYLTVGCEGVAEIQFSTKNSSGGTVHADGTAFAVGERVWLQALDGLTDLDDLGIRAVDAQGNLLYAVSHPAVETDSKTLTGTVLGVSNGYFLVEPVEDVGAEQVLVPMENMQPSPEPEVGDLLQIEFLGKLLDSQPAEIDLVQHISVLKDISESATSYETNDNTDGTQDSVIQFDLNAGPLTASVEQLDRFVFWTNTGRIVVRVKSNSAFVGEIVLSDCTQEAYEIMFADVSKQDNKLKFTNLTSARKYGISCEGLEGCTLIIKQ